MLSTWKEWPIETPERILGLVSSKFILNSNYVDQDSRNRKA